MTDSHLVQIARWFNAEKVSAAPISWFGALSLFVDEFYENYDYDIIGPRMRKRVTGLLKGQGYRQRSGRRFEGPHGPIEFPKPTRSLASDPGREFEDVLGRGIILATPTQVLLTTIRRGLLEEHEAGMRLLCYEQPANLDKITQWLRRTDHEAAFAAMKPSLKALQAEGADLRRRGRFRSQLPT